MQPTEGPQKLGASDAKMSEALFGWLDHSEFKHSGLDIFLMFWKRKLSQICTIGIFQEFSIYVHGPQPRHSASLGFVIATTILLVLLQMSPEHAWRNRLQTHTANRNDLEPRKLLLCCGLVAGSYHLGTCSC